MEYTIHSHFNTFCQLTTLIRALVYTGYYKCTLLMNGINIAFRKKKHFFISYFKTINLTN